MQITSARSGKRISRSGGFQPKPLWVKEPNTSTYYDVLLDKQGKVPTKNLDELKIELGIKIK